MTSGQLSNIRFQLTSICTAAQAAGTTFTVTNDIIENQVITATNASILLSTIDGKIIERMRGTFAAGVFTIGARGLTRAATETADSSLQKEWRPGTLGKIVAFAFDNVDVDNTAAQTLAGAYTFTGNNTFSGANIFSKSIKVPVYADATARDTAIPSPANGMLIYNTALGVNQQYVGGAWVNVEAGGTFPNASETVAGKVEQATTAEMGASTETGGTGAPLFVNPKNLVKTSSGSADENKIPVLNSLGNFAEGFVATYYFGDGSDGALSISSGTTTLTKDTYYTDLTVSDTAVLNPNGYRVFVSGTFSGNGTIRRNGNAGGNGGDGGNGISGAAGAAGAALNQGSMNAEIAGAAGGTGSEFGGATKNSVGVSASPSYHNVNGAAGGIGGTGGGADTPGTSTAGTSTRGARYNKAKSLADILRVMGSLASGGYAINLQQYQGIGGGGGGGGGQSSSNSYRGGGGGGSGSNGGTIYIEAATWNFTGTIEAIGGAGGNGGVASASGNGGSGGGGAGGSGGIVIAIGRTFTSLYSTLTLTGGTKGTGGAASGGGGGAGADGSNGTAGTLIQITV